MFLHYADTTQYRLFKNKKLDNEPYSCRVGAMSSNMKAPVAGIGTARRSSAPAPYKAGLPAGEVKGCFTIGALPFSRLFVVCSLNTFKKDEVLSLLCQHCVGIKLYTDLTD